MKTITIICLLISSVLFLSSCIGGNTEENENKEIYIEASQGGGAGVPMESQKGAR